ncbi:MAG: rhodanese-like domain-containing protein [Pseudomonadota bacterium]
MANKSVIVDEVDPSTAFQALISDPTTCLIDVRTEAEWQIVGVPDLTEAGKQVGFVQWVQGLDRRENPNFLDEVQKTLSNGAEGRLFFICRSGMRSLAAAHAVAEVLAAKAARPDGGPVHCTNIAEGFEGCRHPMAPAGPASGWKERGLPWCQR